MVKKELKDIKYKNSTNFDNILDNFKYLDKLDEDTINIFKNKHLVGIDPGKNNILSLIDENGNKLTYTKNQRYVECYFRKKQICVGICPIMYHIQITNTTYII
jgi:hypothetical protein